MSRRGSTGRGPAAAAVLDPATATSSIPSTEPLPSDQSFPGAVPIAPVAAAEPVVEPAIETVLPKPERAPADLDTSTAPAAAPLVHVDSTIPLPSDQLTPLVATDGSTDTSATTDAAIAAELAPVIEPMLSAVERDLRDTGVLSDATRSLLRGGPRERGFLGDGVDDLGTDASTRRDWMDPASPIGLLRRDLDAAGFGVVTLGADTVDALRSALDLKPGGDRVAAARARRADGQPRRRFVVIGEVNHDGLSVPIGGPVVVTAAEFERLRAGGSIAADATWADGEDA